jgi:chitodextrinase
MVKLKITVNIVAGAADTTAPAAPSSLAASGTTTTTTNLSWSASSDNVAVTGYNVYQGSTLKATVALYVVTGLTANNAYILCKSKDAAGNISATSNAISVTTLNNTLVYCTSKGNS